MSCPVHNLEWKNVPAGVSKKNGRPYDAFQSCPVRDCKEKPGGHGPVRTYPSTPGPSVPSEVLVEMAKQTALLEKILDALTLKF